VLILEKELLPDSAGAGKQRGGVGQVMTFKNISEHAIFARVRPDKITCAPPGLNGGQVGKTGRVFFNGQEIHEFPILTFNPNDEIRLQMPGGAGFGDVRERSVAAIKRDLELGYITPEGAARDYHLSEVEKL
jgi:N-methylhydantoinase B